MEEIRAILANMLNVDDAIPYSPIWTPVDGYEASHIHPRKREQTDSGVL